MNNISRRAIPALGSAALIAAIASACTAPPPTRQAEPTPPSAQPATPLTQQTSGFPLKIENCGRTLTFAKPPERVLVTYQNVAEILVTLGLGDKIVGVTYGQAYDPPKDIADKVNALNYLSPRGKGSAVKEVTLATNPDFVIAAYLTYDFDTSRGLAAQADFEAAGAPIYGISAECEAAVPNGNIQTVYKDILNIGKIFGVEARAQTVVQTMQDRIAAVQSKIAGKPPIKVAFYDAGEDQLGFYGSGLNADMIRLAGGENVFANQPQVYLQVSKEVFAAETPDIFAVIDYEGSPSAPSEELARAEFLFKTFPNMPASKNKNWVAVSGAAFAAGVRIPDAIDVMAKAFHPEVFGAVTTVGAKTVYPVTVENCAKQITISKKPERVIVSWGGQAAYLLSLGQTSNLIGMYYRFADEENRVVPPSAREAYLKIPVIGGEKAPGKEVPLALSPDFFYSDSPSDFSPGQATVEDFAAAGATVFSSVYGCTDPNKQTLNLMFAEIKTLGVIFDEQAKAQALVEKIKTDLAKTEAKVAGLTPVKAVLIEGSDQTLYAAGNGLVTDAFARAGGINLFDGATYDAPPSREKLAASEPDVVVNWDTDVEKLAPVMQTVFANAPAVQNKRVVGVRYIGGIGIRVAELVDALAREFHPEAFK